MTLLLAAGIFEIAVSVVLHFVVVLRLRDAGAETFVSLAGKGGALDYGKYLKSRHARGWSPWIVYLIPVFFLGGVATTAIALSLH